MWFFLCLSKIIRFFIHSYHGLQNTVVYYPYWESKYTELNGQCKAFELLILFSYSYDISDTLNLRAPNNILIISLWNINCGIFVFLGWCIFLLFVMYDFLLNFCFPSFMCNWLALLSSLKTVLTAFVYYATFLLLV